jgi:hypothetical protein
VQTPNELTFWGKTATEIIGGSKGNVDLYWEGATSDWGGWDADSNITIEAYLPPGVTNAAAFPVGKWVQVTNRNRRWVITGAWDVAEDVHVDWSVDEPSARIYIKKRTLVVQMSSPADPSNTLAHQGVLCSPSPSPSP